MGGLPNRYDGKKGVLVFYVLANLRVKCGGVKLVQTISGDNIGPLKNSSNLYSRTSQQYTP